MNKDRIIERLKLEMECLVDFIEEYHGGDCSEIDAAVKLSKKLEEAGFKHFPPFRKQTAEDREYIRKLSEDPLIVEEEVKKDSWDWVKTEYVALFKAKNPAKGKHAREATARMKKLFAANPEIRKEDVLLTTKLYLSQTDSRYIRFPHFFLKKGQGANAIYEFDTWYEEYLESKEAGKGRSSSTNTMQ